MVVEGRRVAGRGQHGLAGRAVGLRLGLDLCEDGAGGALGSGVVAARVGADLDVQLVGGGVGGRRGEGRRRRHELVDRGLLGGPGVGRRPALEGEDGLRLGLDQRSGRRVHGELRRHDAGGRDNPEAVRQAGGGEGRGRTVVARIRPTDTSIYGDDSETEKGVLMQRK